MKPLAARLLLLLAGLAPLAAMGEAPVPRIAMLLFRGCEEACRGFQGYFRQQGIAAAAFYSLAYLFMTVGAFAIIVWLGDAPESGSEMARYESLFYRRPYLAGALTLFLLALAGTPATAGFVGKVLLVRNAMEFGGWLLVAALAVTTGISAYAYLRVVLVMIRRPAAAQVVEGAAWHEAAAAEDPDQGEEEARELGTPWPLAVVVIVAAAATIYLGLFPQGAIAALSSLLPV